MTDLVPRPAAAELAAADGNAPGFLTLAARVAKFSAAALALTEGLHRLQRQMDDDAKDADRLAEMCGAAEVDPRFTALITEAAGALRAVASASGEMANAADLMATAADDVGAAHEREYRGVYEAVRASGVQQAKPGFYRTR